MRLKKLVLLAVFLGLLINGGIYYKTAKDTDRLLKPGFVQSLKCTAGSLLSFLESEESKRYVTVGWPFQSTMEYGFFDCVTVTKFPTVVMYKNAVRTPQFYANWAVWSAASAALLVMTGTLQKAFARPPRVTK